MLSNLCVLILLAVSGVGFLTLLVGHLAAGDLKTTVDQGSHACPLDATQWQLQARILAESSISKPIHAANFGIHNKAPRRKGAL